VTDGSASQNPHPSSTAPARTAPVVGFRAWRLTAEGLRSPRVGVVWHERWLRAECHPQAVEELVLPAHEAPDPRCRCGIRAHPRPDLRVCEIDFRAVVGAVTVWGHLEPDGAAVRAEWAEIQALGLHRHATRRRKASILAAADALGVDVVDLPDLELAALRYATPLQAPVLSHRHAVRE